MKLARIEVESFKCIEKAELELGPGLNVLFGKNDLGKTSLGDAVRAALLLPSTSSEAKQYAPWGTAHVPYVRVTFEHREQHFRVEKRFAEGTRTYALLEHSRDGSVWAKQEERRAVDAELRKMLGWGVREPGGKGAPKGLPRSFLTTALLGRPNEHEAVFTADLVADSDGSGRDRLAEALQTLAEDPLFKRMLTTAQHQVDAVKLADGTYSRRRESPIVKIGERIKLLQQEHEQLMNALQESQGVEAAVRGHLERRAELTVAVEAARHELAELDALHLAGLRMREADERAQAARRRVDELDALLAKRDALATEAATLQAAIAEAERAVANAELELHSASAREREAEALVAKVAEDAAAPTRAHEQALQQRKLQLDAQHERAIAKRQAVIAALALESEARTTERAADDAHANVRRRETAQNERARALAQAEARARELTQLAAWWTWQETQAITAALVRDDAEASSLAAQSRLRREAAERDRAALAPLPDRALLEALRGLEARRQLAEHQAAVGFAVRLELKDDARITIASDGGDARPLAGARELAAERELTIAIAELGTIAIAAGSAALRRELVDARARWQSDAVPVLAQHGLADTNAL
ncbi:MAG TPA: AAA family ATPase, partial [Nannocystaceae bacterium]|nr:AAA family ATPase [Nannocystaceae bacterium]